MLPLCGSNNEGTRSSRPIYIYIYIYIYMGFRARLRQKDIGAVWNNFLMIMMVNDVQGWRRPTFSRHLSFSWGKTPEKHQPGKLTRPGIEPGPARLEATTLPLDHSGERARHHSQPWIFEVRRLILQPFFRFSYVTSSSINSPGEPWSGRKMVGDQTLPIENASGASLLQQQYADEHCHEVGQCLRTTFLIAFSE